MISQVIFALLFIGAVVLFSFNARKIYRNIKLGRKEDRSDRPGERLKTMVLVALGQKKMFKRPFPALLHLFVYLGFIIINIEMLEIVIDGLFGTHRVFVGLGPAYNFLIGAFEWLALSVLLACVVFLTRRNIARLRRFSGTEMKKWPRTDANFILIAEILLMSAFL